ncbi:hypothetical protein [Nocardia mangyaensis]|uniref:hypothetical protein n=1 Tax=Nocardia mangyaensis TaxID=2213200 RepID=UPI0026761310|nr:hypothetical protein [Nocardia mangyaensis]MDO3647734.1 hypothetical protein [Nocardia mangyaensis]
MSDWVSVGGLGHREVKVSRAHDRESVLGQWRFGAGQRRHHRDLGADVAAVPRACGDPAANSATPEQQLGRVSDSFNLSTAVS